MDDGVAAAVLALHIGTLSKLLAKGVLTTQEVRDVFDNATYQLEAQGLAHTEAGKVAHGLLSQLQSIFEAPPAKPLGDN